MTENKQACTECDYWREMYFDLLRIHAEEVSKLSRQSGIWSGVKNLFRKREAD